MNLLQRLFKKNTAISTPLTVSSSNGFHLRPIAKFVNEVKKFETTVNIVFNGQSVTATQVPKILSLSLEKNATFTLECRGKNAQITSKHLSDFFIQLMQDDKEITKIRQETESYEGKAIQGTSINKGIGIGILVKYLKKNIHNTTEKSLSLKDALLQTEQDLNSLYQANKQKEEAEIFLAHIALLSSELFQENFKNIDKEIEKLRGGKFESRIIDYKDIKKRIESHMGIHTKFTLPNENKDACIVIANELLPSEVEELSKLNVAGVILIKGSITSHASILLRSFNIPSIIIKKDILPTTEYPQSILDASSGQFIYIPTKEDFKKANQKLVNQKKQATQSYDKRFEKAETRKGKEIKILANITDLNSAKEAKELGANGIGLLRTEFLFTQKKPSIEEQKKAYQEIFELFDEITVRTLDIGGDKSLPYINIEKEDNPFLGIRGIRFSLKEQTLFKEQLLAIGKAVSSISANNKSIKIMFPMVSTLEEFIKAKNIALKLYTENNISINNIHFGIMLEVPSVIFALKTFDKEVDFYSIGSNDLTQYLFAIERTHPSLSADVMSPILMSALKQIINTTSKPISICGELAGREEAIQELIEMNYQTLSVSAKLIPKLKEIIRNI